MTTATKRHVEAVRVGQPIRWHVTVSKGEATICVYPMAVTKELAEARASEIYPEWTPTKCAPHVMRGSEPCPE